MNQITTAPEVQEAARGTGVVSQDDYIKRNEHLLEAYDHPSLRKEFGVRWLSDGPELGDDYWKACTARMMENTRQFLCPETANIQEAMRLGMRSLEFLGEATTPVQTSAWSGATTLPMVLGLIRKIMPRLLGIRFLAQVQPLDRPTGRIFFMNRVRHDDGTDTGDVENRAGWSYRSWITDPGETSTIATSFNLVLTSKDLTAISRKYKVESSIEVEQDLRAYFGQDAVALISEAGAAELAAEIDETILHTLYHNYTGPLVQYGAAPSAYDGDQGSWDQRILEAINRASELIYSKKRVRPNRIVCGSEMAIILQRLPQFTSMSTNAQFRDQSLGIQQLGTVANQYTVMAMPLPFPVDDMMLSFQGDTPLDGTYIWAPYVPLQQYASDMNPATMVRTISWLRRDADFIVDKGYVGLVRNAPTTITGLSYPAFTEYVGTWETSGGDVT